MLDIGLVGTGFMAETHLGAYREMDGVRVGAVAAPTSAADFVAEHGLDATAHDAVDALLDADVDAVDVCSPTPTHEDAVTAAAERGVDVFCEKPLALDLAAADRIRTTAADAEITVMPGHVLRFFPAYRAIHDALAEDAVGTVGTVRARRLSPPPDWATWYADHGQSGGVFVDLAIHEFDFCRWTLGDVTRVFARDARREEVHRGQATLRFASGAVATVEAGWDRPPGTGLTSEFEVAGDDGLLAYDSTDDAPLTLQTTGETAPLDPPVERDGFRRELDAFVESVRDGTAPPVTVADAIAALRISLAARASAARDEPVAPAAVEP